ncbi:MAG: ATP-binding protein [Geminicoccaceae bacterium]
MMKDSGLRPHLLILVINIATTVWLFAKTQTIDIAGNHETLSEVNELKTLSLDLHRSVFELNVDWLNNYDPIVDSQKRRNHVIEHLHQLSEQITEDKKAAMLLDRLSAVVKIKDDILEEIKQVHSQKKNSDIFFPLLLGELFNSLDKSRGSFRERGAMLRLGDLVAIYSTSLSDEAKRDVEKQIETIDVLYSRRVADDPELGRLLGSIIEYARILVDQAGRLENLSQDFLALGYDDVVADLYTLFSRHFAREQQGSQSLFPMLYGILAFMIVHIAFLFAQLLTANRRALERADDLAVHLQHEKEVNGLQRQFVSMVSHEFRTPLAIIDGSAQRLMRSAGKGDPERISKVSEKIRLSVSRLIDLMESVLSVARLEEGKIQFDETEMNLRQLVAEVIGNYRDLHGDRTISFNIDALPTSCLGDPKLLRQVISNLLSNAIKYSEGGSPVDVEAAIEDGMIAIAVQDHGVGIPEDEIDKISQRFFRASSATGIAGTGIGLHLVQYILNLHDGWLDVKSVLGEGSRFTARLAAKIVSTNQGDIAGAKQAAPIADADPALAQAS